MIRTKRDLNYYLECDRVALGLKGSLKDWVLSYTWRYQRALRKYEYYYNRYGAGPMNLMMIFYFFRTRRLGRICGYQIHRNVFGPGLSIAHLGTIIVNSQARVGKNCRLHNLVHIATLPHEGMEQKAPTIGDNVFIGAGAVIVGDITIANNIAIGANSYVDRSFLEEGIVIAGSPAKKVSDHHQQFWLRATDIVDNEQRGNAE
ncbi:MAG: DapH/DapD/GlmU-related protein [Methanomassiliicoccales archaeon]